MLGINELKLKLETLITRHANLRSDIDRLFGKWQFYPEIVFAVIDRLAQEELDRRRLEEARKTIEEIESKQKDSCCASTETTKSETT